MKIYHSFSSEETRKIGEMLAKRTKRTKAALVFALQGELGAGKTTFVQGFFKGLGLKKRVPSPTFIIMRRHTLGRRRAEAKSGAAPAKRFANIFHIDAYRLKKSADFKTLGFKDVFADSRNIVLIEWAERAKKILPKDAIWLAFRHGKHENERHIMMKQ